MFEEIDLGPEVVESITEDPYERGTQLTCISQLVAQLLFKLFKNTETDRIGQQELLYLANKLGEAVRHNDLLSLFQLLDQGKVKALQLQLVRQGWAHFLV
jgi:hypothetical protein